LIAVTVRGVTRVGVTWCGNCAVTDGVTQTTFFSHRSQNLSPSFAFQVMVSPVHFLQLTFKIKIKIKINIFYFYQGVIPSGWCHRPLPTLCPLVTPLIAVPPAERCFPWASSLQTLYYTIVLCYISLASRPYNIIL